MNQATRDQIWHLLTSFIAARILMKKQISKQNFVSYVNVEVYDDAQFGCKKKILSLNFDGLSHLMD